jgi:hypothetical protein
VAGWQRSWLNQFARWAAAHRRMSNFEQSRPQADCGLSHQSASMNHERGEVRQELCGRLAGWPCRARCRAERRPEQLSWDVAAFLGPFRYAGMLGPKHCRAQLQKGSLRLPAGRVCARAVAHHWSATGHELARDGGDQFGRIGTIDDRVDDGS